MEIEKLVEPAVDWTGGTWAKRLDQSASLLFLHGYITQAQRVQIANRIEKQFRAGIEAGRIVARTEEPVQ